MSGVAAIYDPKTNHGSDVFPAAGAGALSVRRPPRIYTAGFAEPALSLRKPG